jgi:anaerobic ribonucleoside-triphosphate reductase activating protein
VFYHNITKDDLLNGDGIRVVLWVAGCLHKCKGCQNPVTWNSEGGKPFTAKEIDEIFIELSKDYVSGITFSGGDPLHPANRFMILNLSRIIKQAHPHKTIWMYTGYTWEEIVNSDEMFDCIQFVDVLVDGRFEIDKLDKNAHWVGSTNQRVISVKNSLKEGAVVEFEGN